MKNKKKNQSESRSLFDKCDVFFAKYDLIWFWLLFGVTLLISLLLYDPRVSTGGDDSEYILSAHRFLKDFKFPGYQGPLYPIILSLVDAVFGMSLTAFKAVSILSILAYMFVMFQAFRNRIPSTLLFITLLLTSINSHVLYFASQTYSETFYMAMQALLLLVFFRLFIDKEQQENNTIPGKFKRHLLLAITLLGVILTRSVGYALFIAMIGYFALYKQWKNIAWLSVCFVLCFGVYLLLKYILWGDTAIQASGQGASLLYKDFYKPEYGHEDFMGFIHRWWVNSNQYISRFFMAILGLRETYTSEATFVDEKPMITILVYLLGLIGLWLSYRQNRYIFFSGIVAGISLVVTFIILQTSWNQFRLIIPEYSLMVLLLFSAVYYILKLPKFRSWQFVLFIPVVILFFAMLSDTSKAVQEAGKLKNEYSGLTPDWLHYVQASAWIANNLPEDALVACRKPGISSIYAKGKEFYGITRVNSSNFNAFYARWKADSLAFSLIPTENMSDQMYNAMLGHCAARLLLGETYYLAVTEPAFVQQLSTYWPDLQIISSPQKLKPIIEQAGNQTTIYYADSLLLPLQQRRVTHLLTASLRLNPYIKDGRTINTVERVASFIQEKYPGIFQQMVQFGESNDEPAVLYQLNWEVVKKED